MEAITISKEAQIRKMQKLNLAEDEFQKLINEKKKNGYAKNRKLSYPSLKSKSKIPNRLDETCSFEKFEVDKENESAFNLCKAYASKYPDVKKGICIYGPKSGIGKTFLAVSIAKELMQKGFKVLFMTACDFSRTTSRAQFGELTYLDLVDEYDVIVLDDLGQEHTTPYIKTFFYSLFNMVYNTNKTLILTTNLDSSKIASRYDEAGKGEGKNVSRLVALCSFVRMTGKDRRV